MPRINVLPKNIADLIAAGEVVERPSSVIKEFVENSIDANSRKITVEIKNGGKTYIRVTDDGCGIESEDVRKAFISHATSKISSASDLDAISTLGFRGEALASVCAVSKVEMMTAVEGAECGTRYVIAGGEEISFEEIGSPVGTTLVVRDLFYNIPARLKFLKKDVQEGNYIASILERIAISNPHIAFKFIRDGKLNFQTPGDGDLKSAIYAVFGKEFTSQLIPAYSDMNGIKVNGFVTKPVAGRSSRSMQTFFVNGRYVKSVVFLSALEAAYKNSIMVGKYPACVLFVELPFEAVDVNVHPAKTEVRFFEEKKLFDAIYNCTLSAINDDKTRVQASFTPAKAFIDAPVKGEQLKIDAVSVPSSVKIESKQEFVVKEYGAPITGVENRVNSSADGKTFDFLKDDYMTPKVEVVTPGKSEASIKIVEEETTKKEAIVETVAQQECLVVEVPVRQAEVVETSVECESEKASKIDFRYIGEIFNTYLMAEVEGKLILIDKHAAHERILFEKFKKQGAGESQMMLMPVAVTLSADEYSAVIDNLYLLQQAGYEVDDFGDRTVKVSACPPPLVDENIIDIITEIAGYLSNNIKTLMPEKLDWIYHSMACRAAVKAGNFTSSYEAEKFVEVLLSDDSIRYCPHGRPVLIEITQRELEKQFGRIV
ncbi:MAG: DNA mismatch repair endonuclease MutL [Clostridia bacterium]|nr:DNA mismatch repair endonuclease MutL [Clostridia bacterium]